MPCVYDKHTCIDIDLYDIMPCVCDKRTCIDIDLYNIIPCVYDKHACIVLDIDIDLYDMPCATSIHV